VKRRPQKRLDYLLRYRRDFPIAVVEAKTIYANPGDGLQQAKEYAQILGLKFAYSTNGHGIVEHDFLTGQDNDLEGFPAADDLWGRIRAGEGIDASPWIFQRASPNGAKVLSFGSSTRMFRSAKYKIRGRRCSPARFHRELQSL
jgi:type I restriction enzyme R subunit